MGQLLKTPFCFVTVSQSLSLRPPLSDQVASRLTEQRGIFRMLVSAMVAFMRMGVKAPVHRTLGSAKSNTMIMQVVEIAAGKLATKLLVNIVRINVIIFRLGDHRTKWIPIARLRSFVTV